MCEVPFKFDSITSSFFAKQFCRQRSPAPAPSMCDAGAPHLTPAVRRPCVLRGCPAVKLMGPGTVGGTKTDCAPVSVPLELVASRFPTRMAWTGCSGGLDHTRLASFPALIVVFWLMAATST